MNYMLNNMESLKRLQREKMLKDSIRRIVLDINDDVKADLYEKRLNRYYFACGCKEGAIAVYISFICSFIAWQICDSITLNAWWILLAMLLSALFGKLLGIIISRYRIKKIFHALETHFRNNPAGNIS